MSDLDAGEQTHNKSNFRRVAESLADTGSRRCPFQFLVQGSFEAAGLQELDPEGGRPGAAVRAAFLDGEGSVQEVGGFGDGVWLRF